jgi:hypothetical protein
LADRGTDHASDEIAAALPGEMRLRKVTIRLARPSPFPDRKRSKPWNLIASMHFFEPSQQG